MPDNIVSICKTEGHYLYWFNFYKPIFSMNWHMPLLEQLEDYTQIKT